MKILKTAAPADKGITVKGGASAISSLTTATDVTLASTGVTIGHPVFATTNAGSTSITFVPDADKTVITNSTNATVVVDAGADVTLGANGTYTFTGSTVTPPGTHGVPGVPSKRITTISNAGATEVQQGATLTVAGPKTGNGTIEVNGTLTVATGGSVVSGATTVNGTLNVNAGTYSNTAAINVSGTGTVNVSVADGITVAAGTIVLGNGGQLKTTSPGTVAGGTAYEISGTTTITGVGTANTLSDTALTTGATAGYGFAITGGVSLLTNTTSGVAFTPTAAAGGAGEGPVTFSGTGITIPVGTNTKGKLTVVANGVIAGVQVSHTVTSAGSTLTPSIGAITLATTLLGYVGTYPNGVAVTGNTPAAPAASGYTIGAAAIEEAGTAITISPSTVVVIDETL